MGRGVRRYVRSRTEDLRNRPGEESARAHEIEHCTYLTSDLAVIPSWDFLEKKMCNSSSDDGDECRRHLGRWFRAEG
jgi:hypothetical protein